MHFARWAPAFGLCAILLALPPATAATYPCENCSAGVGPYNIERSTDKVVVVAGHRQRLLNASGVSGNSSVLNHDDRYILPVVLAQGQQAWALNIRQRHPEPQASRTLRRYY
jgi:hypothetical protein